MKEAMDALNEARASNRALIEAMNDFRRNFRHEVKKVLRGVKPEKASK